MKAGRGHLLFGGGELGFARGELGARCIQLGLSGGGLRFALGKLAGGLVELVLGGEGIDCALDVGQGLELVEGCPDGILLALVKAGGAGVENNAGRTTRRRREGSLQLVGHLLGFGARDGEVVGHGAVECRGRAANGHQDGEPQGDDQPAAAIRELA